MLTIAICDDSAQDSARLREALIKQLTALNHEAETALYPCGEALTAAVEQEGQRFALVFLDNYMDGLTGMETARRLRALGQKMPLVFLSSTADFAVESYEVQAAGYLVKPLCEDKLAALLTRLLAPTQRPCLALDCSGVPCHFYFDEIYFIESQDHALFLHAAGGNTFRATGKLGEIAALLDERFLRCHQSYLVNMDHIARVEDDFILCDGARVPIRVRTHKALSDNYYRYFVTHTMAQMRREADE